MVLPQYSLSSDRLHRPVEISQRVSLIKKEVMIKFSELSITILHFFRDSIMSHQLFYFSINEVPIWVYKQFSNQSINVKIHLRKYSVILALLLKYVVHQSTSPSVPCPPRNSLITLTRYGLPVTLMYLTNDYNVIIKTAMLEPVRIFQIAWLER